RPQRDMASQLTATLTPAGPRSVCSPLCAALPEPHDFRIAPCALGYPAPARPQTNTKVQLAGSSDPWLVEFATDSPLEGDGFELAVPQTRTLARKRAVSCLHALTLVSRRAFVYWASRFRCNRPATVPAVGVGVRGGIPCGGSLRQIR